MSTTNEKSQRFRVNPAHHEEAYFQHRETKPAGPVGRFWTRVNPRELEFELVHCGRHGANGAD